MKDFTETTAREMIAILSTHFVVTGVTFRWNRTCRGKHYTNRFSAKNEVTVPHPSRGRSFKAQEQSLLHEFAHALVHARNRFVRGHGTVFQDALFEVATVWHGDPAKYDWSQEYSTVRQAAENRFGDKWAHDVPDVDVVWNDAKGDWE